MSIDTIAGHQWDQNGLPRGKVASEVPPAAHGVGLQQVPKLGLETFFKMKTSYRFESRRPNTSSINRQKAPIKNAKSAS